jgi:hypothetical protein
MSAIGHNSRTMPGNWLAINRDIEKHPIVGFGQPVKPADPKRGSYSRGEAWQSLLFQAQFAPGEMENKGRTVLLDRGQLMAGLQHLADKWNWSMEAVRWFLRKLEQASMALTAEPVLKESRSSLLTPVRPKQTANPRHNTVRVLSICNYNVYQIALEIDNMLGNKPNPKRTPSAPQESNKETNKQTHTDAPASGQSDTAWPNGDFVHANGEAIHVSLLGKRLKFEYCAIDQWAALGLCKPEIARQIVEAEAHGWVADQKWPETPSRWLQKQIGNWRVHRAVAETRIENERKRGDFNAQEKAKNSAYISKIKVPATMPRPADEIS